MVPLAVQKSFTGVSHRYLSSGCGLAVGPEPPKLVTRVRIPAPAYLVTPFYTAPAGSVWRFSFFWHEHGCRGSFPWY